MIRLSGSASDQLLVTEAEVIKALPREVGYPRVLGTGEVEGRPWIATVRLPGDNLERLWPHLASAERARAIVDLLERLDHVHGTDPNRLPALAPTPLYSFDEDVLVKQLSLVARILDQDDVHGLEQLIRAGLGALDAVPRCLVHTDAGPSNTVWDGTAAIPVDFEFACLGPADLDLEHVARQVFDAGDDLAVAEVSERLRPSLDDPATVARLRFYTVSWNLWALGKWAAKDPRLTNAATWGPVRELIRDARSTSWVDAALALR